jgi:broad specificity phosphatase PhoE
MIAGRRVPKRTLTTWFVDLATIRAVRVTIIRHGESEGNVAATLQGCRIDPPLSSRGRRQAEALSIRLSGESIDVVVASPMKRARETAATVVLPHGVPIRIDSDLVEFDWGNWTGRPLDEEMERHVEQLRARWRAGDVGLATPEGESPLIAAERARRVLDRLQQSGAGAPVLVAHGRFNRILMAVLLGRDLSRMDEIRQRNASISAFEWNGVSGATPILLDSVDHLTGDATPREPLAGPGASDSIR